MDTIFPPARDGRRTQQDRRGEAEARMLEVAQRLVAEAGLDALTLAAVGEGAGYSRGLPAHHFGSRDGLVARLTENVVTTYLARMRTIAADASPLEQLTEFVRRYLAGVTQDSIVCRAFVEIQHAALKDAAAAAAFALVNARALKGIETMIQRAQADGEVRLEIDAVVEAALLLALLRGIVVMGLADPAAAVLLQSHDQIAALALARLK